MHNFILVLLLFATVSAHASPRWACAVPRHEFGVRESTESVECDFVLKNTGEQPLEFGRLYACCGVVAELKERKLAPGAQAILHAKLSLLLLKGQAVKVLYLATNDPASPTCRLEIAGTVTPVLEIEPQSLVFEPRHSKLETGDGKFVGKVTGEGTLALGKVAGAEEAGAGAPVSQGEATAEPLNREPGTPTGQTVVLRWKKAGDFAVTRVSCSQKWLAAEAVAESLNGEPRTIHHWELRVRLVPPLPPRVALGYVTAYTDRPGCPPVMIPVTVTSPGTLKVTPSELVLVGEDVDDGKVAGTGRLKPPQQTAGATRVLAVRAPPGGVAFRVTRVELPVPEMTAAVKPAADGRTALITLRGIGNPKRLDGSQIRIFTDVPAAAELVVPIRGSIQPPM